VWGAVSSLYVDGDFASVLGTRMVLSKGAELQHRRRRNELVSGITECSMIHGSQENIRSRRFPLCVECYITDCDGTALAASNARRTQFIGDHV